MLVGTGPPDWQYHLNPWWRQRLVYVSRFSRDECRRLLNETTTRFLGRSVRRALFTTADFTLYRMTLYSNSFRPYAYVYLRDNVSRETIVEVTLTASASLRAFLFVWYGFLALFTLIVAVSAVGQRAQPDVAPVGVFILAFVAFPLLLSAFGRSLAMRDRGFLISFLVDELQLTPAPPSAIPIA